jgi:organic radical activating enzyme
MGFQYNETEMIDPPLGPVVAAPLGTIFIELTSHCNMHCVFCPSDVLRRPKGHLSEGRLRSFLDQIQALGLRTPILLNVLGEPLLSKNIYSLLDKLEADGHPVTLITNMTLLGDPEVRRELLRHGNLTLAMSLQTATRRSYAMRGYDRLPFKAFFKIFLQVVEDKFRSGSGARLEIHVASNYILAHDASIQADGGLDLWANFPNEKAERRWIARMLRRLDRLAEKTRRRHPEAFAAGGSAVEIKYKEHLGTRIALERAGLPPDFHRLKDDAFWGYMPLPEVFLVFKSFELWTRDRAFLKHALPPGRFAFLEEREDPRKCSMADNFGLLANGDFVLCCLDYEGEMALGNIDVIPVADLLRSDKRDGVRRNAMAEAICRRCKGNLFVFDTASLTGATEQPVDKFGRGWWPRESDLYGIGGRWTNGKAWAYVLVRFPAHRLRLSFRSDFAAEAPLKLAISIFDPASDSFPGVFASFPIFGRKGEKIEFEAAYAFEAGRLYRLEIDSPSFVPDETLHNGDSRRLGLAVFSMTLAH